MRKHAGRLSMPAAQMALGHSTCPEGNAEGGRAALDTIDPDSYIHVNDIRGGQPMKKTSTPSSASPQEKLERARLALLKVSPEARTGLLNEFLAKRKTRST